jgi:hypothetical protein
VNLDAAAQRGVVETKPMRAMEGSVVHDHARRRAKRRRPSDETRDSLLRAISHVPIFAQVDLY